MRFLGNFWLLTLVLLFSAKLVARAGPLLTLEGQSTQVPFLNDYLKDPGVYRIANRQELRKYLGQAQLAKQALARDQETWQNYFTLLSEICYFYFRQRRSSSVGRREKSCHLELIKTGRHLIKNYQTRAAKISYNIGLSLFALAKYREAHRSLNKLVDRSLANPLAVKAGLIIYLIDLQVKRTVASSSYNRLLAKVDVRGKTIIDLVTARHLAGLDLTGKSDRRPVPQYKHHLRNLTNYVPDLPTEAQEQVLTFVVGVVRKADKPIDWQNFPTRIETFAYTSKFPALLERQALFALRQKRFADAIALYQRLLPMVKGQQATVIARQLLALANKLYRKNKDAKQYQKIIHSCAKYLTSSKDKEQLSKHVYKNLIVVESRNIATMPVAKLKQTLLIIKDLLKLQVHQSQIIASHKLIAKIHLRLGNLREAIKIYHSLFKKHQVVADIDLALKYQHRIAKWPTTITWKKQPAILRADRLYLQQIYGQKLALQKTPSWYILAQHGLLSINLGAKSKGYNLWLANVDNRTPKLSEVAIGIVINDYLNNKKWLKIETIIQRCLRVKLVPKIKGRPIDLNRIYSDALDNVINLHIKKNELSLAQRKGEKFYKLFPKDNRQAKNLFRLSEVFVKLKNYPQAMTYLNRLVTNYQGNIYYQKSLLRAANIAKRQGDEQRAMVFYRLFFNNYPNHRAIKTVVYQLRDLYLALRLYGDLQNIHSFIASSSLFTTIEKQRADIASMEIEERYGSGKKARQIASRVLAQAGRHPKDKALASSILARHYFSRKDLASLLKLESKLSRRVYEYKIPRNELSFYISESYSFVNDKIIKRYERQPTAFLKYLTNSFNMARKNHLEVCKLPQSRFCLPSYLRLVGRCSSFVSAINTIELSAASSRQNYALFMQEKRQLIAFLEGQKKAFQFAAVREIQNGNATFEWIAKSLVHFPELNLSYINGYLAEPDYLEFDLL